ncbi:MAG: hypothetical protein RLZZ253_1437, partial [Verrucomicrobiota bacterium]
MNPLHLSHAGRHLLSRRHFLQWAGTGLGGVALTQLLSEQGLLAADGPLRPEIDPSRPYAPRVPHHPAKAKRVLMVFCSGALSHVDTFDYKPELVKRHDTPMPGSGELVTFQGAQGNLIKPIWDFKPRGQSGKMISDLLPNLAELADDMCFIHSNLPAFVAIPDPRGVPQIGARHWSSAFLPATFQGTSFNAQRPIPNLQRPETVPASADAATRDFLKRVNDRHLAQHPGDGDLAARISAYELAAKMQLAAAEVSEFGKESPTTLEAYGVNDANANKAGFAKNCLLARRLLER